MGADRQVASFKTAHNARGPVTSTLHFRRTMHHVAVGAQLLPGGDQLVADRALLRVIVVQPVHVRLDGVARAKGLAALGTRVGGVEVVPLHVVGQVGERGVLVLAHDAGPGDGARVVAVLRRHGRDDAVQLCNRERGSSCHT